MTMTRSTAYNIPSWVTRTVASRPWMISANDMTFWWLDWMTFWWLDWMTFWWLDWMTFWWLDWVTDIALWVCIEWVILCHQAYYIVFFIEFFSTSMTITHFALQIFKFYGLQFEGLKRFGINEKFRSFSWTLEIYSFFVTKFSKKCWTTDNLSLDIWG